ncbi:hypothetical protein ARMA_0409 [Ardenticatena maritima]|uniref:Cytochrome b561 domain-containing protein n=1 Tax=Ardenticatena maritima TaxID=872965 RepID=A0A0M8K7M7_9CHLR|nr:hypothetical protein [Ardenticatena maritima]GAP61986.1 hypothetical protein ARMA_0409 [Ardenticatena maritima]
MTNALVELHDVMRWLVLLALLVAGGQSLKKWRENAAWVKEDQKLPLIATILLDVQVLLGIIIWVLEGRWSGQNIFFAYIHPVIMLAALAFAHMMMSRSRKLRGGARHRTVALGLLGALVIVILGVPYTAWPGM